MDAPVTDRGTSRLLIVCVAILAAVGMGGTLFLLATSTDSNAVAVFVGLAGVPIGCLATLATNRAQPHGTAAQIAVGAPTPSPGPTAPEPAPQALSGASSVVSGEASGSSDYGIAVVGPATLGA